MTSNLASGSSLDVSRRVNVRSPSCAPGTPSSSAANGTAGGPSTDTEGEFDSRRPSSVQTASPVPQESPPAADAHRHRLT